MTEKFSDEFKKQVEKDEAKAEVAYQKEAAKEAKATPSSVPVFHGVVRPGDVAL